MSFSRVGRGVGLSLLLVFALSCRRGGGHAVSAERLSIVAFDNLTGDDSLNWIGAGVSAMVASQVTGAANVHARLTPSPHDAFDNATTQALFGYVTREGSRLRADAVLQDARTGGIVRPITASAADATGLSDALARAIHSTVRPFGTRNPAAIRWFGEAMSTTDIAQRRQGLARAVEADPGFADAYVMLAELASMAGDRPDADRWLSAAETHVKELPALERAKLALLRARLSGDPARQAGALRDLAQLEPANIQLWQELSALETKLRRFPFAVAAHQKMTQLAPGQPVLWNALAYAQAWNRDLAGATASLREYEKRAPTDPNPLDSLGDVHYMHGRFADAERFYMQAHAKNAAFLGGGTLAKAAQARLMTGDAAGAGALFARFIDLRKQSGDPLAAHREAQWNYVAGKRTEAIAQWEKLSAEGPPQVRLEACAHLAIVLLDGGDGARARQFAERAAAIAPQPAAPLLFVTARASSAAQWTALAGEQFAGPMAAARQSWLGYALLLHREFAAAALVWRPLFEGAGALDSNQPGLMYAWALVESKQAAAARDLLELYPTPNRGEFNVFDLLAFPRQLEWRAAMLEATERAADAGALRATYAKLHSH